MILVDTWVWVDQLRAGDQALAGLLEAGKVLAHPFVIGELALGSLPRRDQVLRGLRELPQANVATDREVLYFVDRHRLFGLGVGYVDAHLLASVATGTIAARKRSMRSQFSSSETIPAALGGGFWSARLQRKTVLRDSAAGMLAAASRPVRPQMLSISHRRYSITWSARSSTDGGIVIPMARAAFRLMTSSNAMGSSTGRLAGSAPLAILSM